MFWHLFFVLCIFDVMINCHLVSTIGSLGSVVVSDRGKTLSMKLSLSDS